MSRPRVLIVDDDDRWRDIIRGIIEPDCEIVGSAAHGDEVIAAAVALRPDVITLDISMPGTSGLKLLPRLRVLLPLAAIVMVTTTSSSVYVNEAYSRGAKGYVLKGKALTELVPAILAANTEGTSRSGTSAGYQYRG